MPDDPRRPRSRSRKGDSAEKRTTRARQKAEHDVGLLDNPDIPGEPSELRHLLYFGTILGIGFGLNVAAMLLVSGGR